MRGILQQRLGAATQHAPWDAGRRIWVNHGRLDGNLKETGAGEIH